MANEIGWHFPPNGGGREDGYNDSGIATFAGNRLRSLARETLQNSLDAAQSGSERPVNVSFELVSLGRDQEIGREELKSALRSSLEAATEDPPEHQQELVSAIEILERPKLKFLKISDCNTTGLRGNHWRALVKLQGSSRKENPGAGGSHGIGKNAAFAVSPLRTVFYWTCFEENGKPFEKFQGKSILRSHEGAAGSTTQGTGFFGVKQDCRELCGAEISSRFPHFRILNEDKQPVIGAGLWIAGFQGGNDWQRQIAGSVIKSFFHAISNGRLTVFLDSNNDMENRGLMEINKSSLDKWFDWVSEHSDGDNNEPELEETRTFWELTRRKPTDETEDHDFGHCRLWIQVGEGLPSKVALIRATGMLITTDQKRLIRFPGLREFAAVCVFESVKGNELLRKMENPEHDKFEPDRLPENEREKGRKALNRITDWIRDKIKDAAKSPQSKEVALLEELAHLLPDIEPDEEFGADDSEDKDRKQSFDSAPRIIALKPRRKRSYDNPFPVPPDPGPKPVPHRQALPIHDVRVVPLTGKNNHCRVSFMPLRNGKARLQFDEAGDSTDIPRDDIQAFDRLTGKDLDISKIVLKTGERWTFDITSHRPIRNRAFCLRAWEVQTK